MNWEHFRLDTSVNRPLYLLIADQVRALIRSGKLAPGERLPSSRELHKQLRVSMVTIEAGLAKLAGEKLLCRHPRRGTFVAGQSGDTVPPPVEDPEYIFVEFNDINLDSSYWMTVFGELESFLQQQGYPVMFRRHQEGRERLVPCYHHCRGVVLCGFNPAGFCREILRHRLPLVLIGDFDDNRADGDGIAMVVHNDEERARLSTRHLLNLGHRRIACVTGSTSSRHAELQKTGFIAAMRECGVPVDPELFVDIGHRTPEYSRQVALQLLSRDARPTAVYAGNDLFAIEIVNAAARFGLTVPGDLSVIGCGGNPVTEVRNLRLTTTVSRPADTARMAVELLLRQIRDFDTPRGREVIRVAEITFGDTTMYHHPAEAPAEKPEGLSVTLSR